MFTKVIVLDFDGVLNTHTHCELIGFNTLSHRMIDNLNDILAATNAAIVVSSNWRDGRSVDDLQQILKKHGCIGTVIGKTVSVDDCVGLDDDHPLRILLDDSRSNQIKAWLSHNKNVTRFVVIDDIDLNGFINNFVQIDPMVGLCDKDVDKAIKILNA